MKKIVVYSCGDSCDISTWSNVPYLFTQELEWRGYELYRVNIEPNRVLNRIFNTLSFKIYKKLLGSHACPIFARTWLHRFLTYRKLKQISKMYPDADLHLFLSFAFTNPYSNAPSVLWCDWPDATVIERLGREPESYEKKALEHEAMVIKSARLVYSMFPCCAEDMRHKFNRDIIYLNRNVVNTVYNGLFDLQTKIHISFLSQKILFIGNHRYKTAAEDLLRAFFMLSREFPKLELHIIGMTARELGIEENQPSVKCYGYLHKNIEAESRLYYALLLSAKVLVNPAVQWGAFSSSIEAMFYGTPVIVAPYEDFCKTFGDRINFGFYLNNSAKLENVLAQVISAPREKYEAWAKNANACVSDYTWTNYITAFIDSLRSHGISGV